MTRTLVIMPTYNEALNIVNSIEQLFEHNDVDLLVVDDNSPDGTALIAISESKKHSGRLFVLEREQKQGLGPAYLAGFEWAFQHGYLRVVEMDADGSHRAQDLPRLLEAHADLVIGSRWVNGERWQIGRPIARLFLSSATSMHASCLAPRSMT